MIGPAWEYDSTGIPVGTGFSLRRWLIPQYCQWQGKAIYLDADQLVLDDLSELWTADQIYPAEPGTSAWTTWQRDSFSSKPWPQSSVMLIDCAAAAKQWGWHPEQMFAYLRSHPSRDEYVRFMHCQWMQPAPGRIPDEWNHLDRLNEETCILHYTHEPNQPWYNPDHPHSHIWKSELTAAIGRGEISKEEFETALAAWGTRTDWRPTNGLHPAYRHFLELFPLPRATTADPSPVQKVLWVTSFSADLWSVSGQHLVRSFQAFHPTGTLAVYAEDVEPPADLPETIRWNFIRRDDPELHDFLAVNGKWVPRDHGGQADEPLCRCPGGPFEPDASHPKQPCPGYWFNRNHFRWFRKIVSWQRARKLAAQEGFDTLIWIDSDCRWISNRLTPDVVQRWFKQQPVFFFRHTRPVAETGILGFRIPSADLLLDTIWEWYMTGRYRTLIRWDDSYVFQKAKATLRLAGTDLAITVSGNNQVVPGSLVSAWLVHEKGLHKRKRLLT